MAVAVVALVMTGVRGLTVRVSDWFPVPVTLLAEIVRVLVLAVVGVPEMRPVAVFTGFQGRSRGAWSEFLVDRS